MIEQYTVVTAELILPIVAVVFITSAVVALCCKLASKLSFMQVFGFSLAFGFLGGTSGLIAGATSEPIIGAFLTALLGLVSGALSLLFVKGAVAEGAPSPAELRPFVSPAIVVLSLCALLGLTIGRVYQTKWTNYEREYAQSKSINETVYMPLARLWKQYDYCRSKVKDPSSCDVILYREQ